MGLYCAGPHTGGFFSVVNTIVLQDSWFVESMSAELRIWRNHLYGELPVGYTSSTAQRVGVPIPVSFKGQLYLSFDLYLLSFRYS